MSPEPPVNFNIERDIPGIVVTVLVTYLVARIADRWDGTDLAMRETRPGSGWMQRIGGVYLGMFDLDRIMGNRALETPSQLFGAWLYASGRIALVLVPTLWVWSVIASAMFHALPSAVGNNLPSVVLSAVGGTFFMIST